MNNQVFPPCQSACPINTDVREYVNLIARGEFDRALEVISERNPLPASCGYICAHHCEDECRRKEVDGALSIKMLKRFAVENGTYRPAAAPARDTAVAIVGGGPAGLGAAQALARVGHRVTVFDKEPRAGGALRTGIPLYRLPHAALDEDIAHLEELGVKFVTGQELGKDFTIDQLLQQGFSCVLLALGLPVSRKLDIPGADHPKVLLALPFLRDVKFNDFRFNGEDVIVIGGGNVAMDVARSARRAGAGSVKIACLEARHEMPAFPWEIEEAIEEGIALHCSVGPKAIVIDNGDITGLQTKAVLSVFDEQGRFNPTFDEDKLSVIPGNLVIFSIGQAGDTSCLQGSGVPIDERGRIIFDRETFATGKERVFVCGEVAFGPGTAVQAIASGRSAALSIDRYLSGGKADYAGSSAETLPALLPEIADKVKPQPRTATPLINVERRVAGFEPVELGFQLLQALREGLRCLRCGAGAEQIVDDCAHCLTCLRTCPYGVPYIDDNSELKIRGDFCQSCGLCVGICPARAINFNTPEVQEASQAVVRKAEALAAEGGDKLLVFTCAYAPFAMEWYNRDFFAAKPSGVEVIKWPCAGKIDTLDMLKAFEHGAETVLVVGCAADGELTCPYYDTLKWAGKRAAHVREILQSMGVDPDSLGFTTVKAMDTQGFADAVQQQREKMTQARS